MLEVCAKGSDGTSLVELVLALLILAVLLGLAYPSWQRFQAHQSLRYAAAQVATDLREAQERAKAERKAYQVWFTDRSGRYQVQRNDGGFVHVADLPRGVVVELVEREVLVTFSAFGRPNGAYRIVLSNPAGSATVTVDPGGGIRYDAP